MTVSSFGAGASIVLLDSKTMNTTNVDFSNIPQKYRKLILEIINPDCDSDATVYVQPNASSTTSDFNRLSAATASSGIDGSIEVGTIDAGTGDGIIVVEFLNYSSTTSHKAFQFYGGLENSSNVDQAIIGGGRYKSNSAITSLRVTRNPAGANWTAGTANLYGC